MAKDEKSGRILAGRYRLQRSIGRGAHGTVYCAEDLGRSSRHVALKLTEGLVGGAGPEQATEILRRFQHPNWATVLDGGPLDEDTAFQATRLIHGESLDHLEGPQPIDWVWRLLEDGARVLGSLHRHGLIHYDVTPGNFILSQAGADPWFVLTDGGLAHAGPVEGIARGTPMYMAPEVTEDGGHDHRADLYSLGLVAFRLATGRDPLEGGAGEILGKRRREDAPRASTLRDDVPAALDALLADLLSRDPRKRPDDALALLERLNGALDRDVRPFLYEEGLAAAEGGALIGREEPLARFDESLAALHERRSAGGRRLAQARARTARDTVLLLHGQPGCGATRLAEEMTAHARAANVPSLLMAGSEQAGDRRGPLRHLTDGLVTLGLSEGEEALDLRLDMGPGRAVGREERAHASTRAVEQFLRAVEQAARRTPFVLVVQDFSDLPAGAQEAIRVLSRHLLARRESGGRPSSLPVLLVIDLGRADAQSLLLPDAQEPERPLVTLDPQGSGEFESIGKDRLPGFECDAADLERLVAAAEGLPGTFVSLFGEACRRGDLGYESGRWQWDVSGIEDYDIQRGLTPATADALRRADESQRRLLSQLSLVEAPVPESVVAELRSSPAAAPDSTLIQTSSREGRTYYSPMNLAVRSTVLSRLTKDAKTELGRELLTAYSRWDEPEAALDRARLAVQLGDHELALGVLRHHWAALPTDSRESAQKLIREAVESDAALLQSAGGRERVADMLEYGPEAARVAQLVAAALSDGGELETAESVSATLRSARQYAEALAVLERAHPKNRDVPLVDARLWVSKSVILFESHRLESAQEAVKKARVSLRQVAARRAEHPRLVAEFMMAEAQARFHRDDPARATRALRAAQVAAKQTRSPALRARIVNNMGIVENRRGRWQKAIECLERALRLKNVLGDVHGAIKTQLNLGRLRQEEGALVKSAGLFQAAASSARRHAQPVALSRALLLLAQVYDQQLNTRLAGSTLQRAVRVADLAGRPVELARAVWDLAPLLAATGDAEGAAEMLRRSAQAARGAVTSYARAAHHRAAALTALHLGIPDRATLALRRMRRHEETLYAGMKWSADALLHLLQTTGDPTGLPPVAIPPRREITQPERFLWRALVWLGRARRDRGLPPPMPFGHRAPAHGTRPPPLGPDRRLLVEMVLRAAPRTTAAWGDDLLGDLEQRLAHTGEVYLQARSLAARSMRATGGSQAGAAQQFSRAVQLIELPAAPVMRLAGLLPREHEQAHAFHATQLDRADGGPVDPRAAQNALAHRLLARAGCTATPDHRVAAALRRVLEATGRMNAGAGLDDLLEGMTHDTLEITGAERTCVVLVDASAAAQVRVATSASARDQDVSVEDLSQTVIQRVLESQTPLLLHDVFDDQELMGRPSITDLSLRSILCVPMLRGDTLYGVMYADSSSAAGSFDDVDREVLSLFAEQAAGALETHRLVADVQNSMDELKAMQERLVKGERLRTMGELSSGVAHEFNNLLTSILARVQLINLTPVGPELKRDLDLIEKACLDAAAVVRRLQNFTREQRQGHFVRLDLAEICRDAVEFLRPLWSTRRRHGREPVHVQLHADEGLEVNGDPTELREVVTNLLKNALDVVPDGGEISIAAQAVDGLIHLRVLDDGPGIAPEIQARIFDPFFTTKGERGTGLGLCLSQQIIERHGGEIRVESAPGAGSAFHIELPTAGAVVQLSAGIEELPTDGRRKLKVLIVDDDANVREPLGRYLEQSGYEVCVAADGREGLDAVAEHNPEVVITDVAMPEMDGLELCQRLRSQSADLPIVIMSGWSAGVDPTRARRAGATALLGKPFVLSQVADLLDSVSEPAAKATNGTNPSERLRD